MRLETVDSPEESWALALTIEQIAANWIWKVWDVSVLRVVIWFRDQDQSLGSNQDKVAKPEKQGWLPLQSRF